MRGISDISSGNNLATLLLAALKEQVTPLHDDDVLVVTQKIVCKAEGQQVAAEGGETPHMAHMAAQGRKDAAYYEVVLREWLVDETRMILRLPYRTSARIKPSLIV